MSVQMAMENSVGSQPQAQWVNITPELASAWLSQNTNNRKISLPAVQRIADDIRSGRWRANGQAIQFDRENRLIDGQHRLMGVVAADLPVLALVVEGLEPAAQQTIDIGRARSTGNQLQLLGVANSNITAAIAAALIRWDECADSVWSNLNMPSKSRIIDYAATHGDAIEEGIVMAHEAQRAFGVTPTQYGTVSSRCIMKEAHDDWAAFHASVISGAGLRDGDPRLTLRNLLSRPNVRQSGTWNQQLRIALITKAFLAYCEGRELRLLKFLRSELPMPDIA